MADAGEVEWGSRQGTFLGEKGGGRGCVGGVRVRQGAWEWEEEGRRGAWPFYRRWSRRRRGEAGAARRVPGEREEMSWRALGRRACLCTGDGTGASRGRKGAVWARVRQESLAARVATRHGAASLAGGGPDAPEGREGAVRAAAKLGRRLGCSIT